jgi:hypothetical protein
LALGTSENGENALGDLESLTLESAVKMVKEAGYILTLSKKWYITGRGDVYDMNSEKAKERRKFLGSYATKEEAEKIRDEIKNKYGNE